MPQVRILSPRLRSMPVPSWIYSRPERGGFFVPARDCVVRVWLRDVTQLDRQGNEDARTIWFAMQPKRRTIEITQAKGKGKRSSRGFYSQLWR